MWVNLKEAFMIRECLVFTFGMFFVIICLLGGIERNENLMAQEQIRAGIEESAWK